MRDTVMLCVYILLVGTPGVLLSLVYAEFLIGFLLISLMYCLLIGLGFWKYCQGRYVSSPMIGWMSGIMCFLFVPPFTYNLRFKTIETPAMAMFYLASVLVFLGLMLLSRRSRKA